MSPDQLADKHVRVDQPNGTESVVVAFKWPDRDVAAATLTRLLDLYMDYVVTARKEAVLLRIEKMDQQAAVACEDEIKRLDRQIAGLETKLAKSGLLSDDDLDGSMLARQSMLKEDVRKLGQKASELKTELRTQKEDRDQLAPVVEKQAESRYKLKALDDQIEAIELQLKHARESIDAADEELRTLPIAICKAKRHEQADKLTFLREQIKQHDVARAAIGKPGGPPAHGALEGMDAREFTVKSPARVGDKPASSSRKTLFAVTFMGLMAAAFGLLFVYDRRNPAPHGPPVVRPRVVHVTPPPAGPPLTEAEMHRLTARIHQWVRDSQPPIVTPPPAAHPPVTIGPNGQVERSAPPATGAHDPDTDLLAARMQQWLGDGEGPGRPG